MNVLFLYISLSDLSDSDIWSDLIKEFARQGHQVAVATPVRPGMKVGLHKECGIDVLRFKTDQLTANKSNIKKGLAYLKLIYQYPRAVRTYFGDRSFDLIVGHSLPPELGLIIPWMKKYYRARFYLQLCEFIWQDSVALGFYKEYSLICRYYKWLERRLIKSADYVGCPSQGNINFALRHHPWAVSKNIHVSYYCQQEINLSLLPLENIRRKYNLEGKFVAVYGGSVNIAQRIENVVLLAESCKQYSDLVICIIGRGSQMESIKREAVIRGVDNILFLDFMPKYEYMALLSACDVGLVSLNEKLQMPNIPSKTLELFCLSKPIVAAIDYSTDYGTFLDVAQAGLWSYSGDIDGFKSNLLTLYNDRALCRVLGENGRKFFLENMIPEKAYSTIVSHLDRDII